MSTTSALSITCREPSRPEKQWALSTWTWSGFSFSSISRRLCTLSAKMSVMATNRTPRSAVMASIAAPGPRPPQPISPMRITSLPAAWRAAGKRQPADGRRAGCRRHGGLQKVTTIRVSSSREFFLSSRDLFLLGRDLFLSSHGTGSFRQVGTEGKFLGMARQSPPRQLAILPSIGRRSIGPGDHTSQIFTA